MEVQFFEILRNHLTVEGIALLKDEILNSLLTLGTADQIETFLEENDFLVVAVANDFELLLLFLRIELIQVFNQ
jgi:hypothetical protein